MSGIEFSAETIKTVKTQLSFPGGSVVKNLLVNAGDARDAGLIPGRGRATGGGNGNPLHYSCLENSMDRGAWWVIVLGVAKSRTRLSDTVSVLMKSVVQGGNKYAGNYNLE